MQLEHMKTAVVVAWVLTWGVMAVSLNPSSAGNWVLLVASGVLPTLILLRMWQPTAQTLSTGIREVLK